MLKGKSFYKYLTWLHNIWQRQVRQLKPSGNIVHFLVHGNCNKIISDYKKKGIKVIGEVVNAHPVVQEKLLEREYKNYGLNYHFGEKVFSKKILYEYSLCDWLLVPSSFIKNSLIQNGIDENRIQVLPYGLDKPAVVKQHSFISKGRTIRLLYIGQITFRKGTVYLLKAFRELTEQGYNCSLTLIGKIDDQYYGIIKEYLQNAHVNHIAHTDNNNVYQIMTEHDLLIMPSIEDGFGIVVAEALSVHLPVIVTRNSGASEIVHDGINGLIIDAYSSTEITKAVKRSIELNFKFMPVPSWEEYTSELEKIYYSVLN